MTTGHETLLRWVAPEGPWTEPDLHHFPQDGHRYEIVDGSLHVTPPLDDAHETVVDALVAVLRGGAPNGWWAASRMGVRIADSHLVPDVTVLRPGSSGAVWCDPHDVALVVEVEMPATRRYDRQLKPGLYAEAGIASYWRIELPPGGPVAHLYARPSAGRYRTQSSVPAGRCVRAETPFGVNLTPANWLR